MSIRIIKARGTGAVVGYQAIAGVGGPGLSAYFPAYKPAAWNAASAMAEELREIHKATRTPKPSDPLRGLRLVLRPSKRQNCPPHLYVEASWFQSGKSHHRSYSAGANGLFDAVALAVREIEKWRGQKLGMPVQAVKQALLNRHQGAAQ